MGPEDPATCYTNSKSVCGIGSKSYGCNQLVSVLELNMLDILRCTCGYSQKMPVLLLRVRICLVCNSGCTPHASLPCRRCRRHNCMIRILKVVYPQSYSWDFEWEVVVVMVLMALRLLDQSRLCRSFQIYLQVWDTSSIVLELDTTLVDSIPCSGLLQFVFSVSCRQIVVPCPWPKEFAKV